MSLTIDLGKMYAADFEKDNILFCKGLPGAPVAMYILSICYEIFINKDKMKRLEDLPDEEKKIVWETAKEFSAGRITNNEKMKRLCKCLYSLEYILNIP
jgi:hypothetical protein